MNNLTRGLGPARQVTENPFIKQMLDFSETAQFQLESRRLSNETSVLKEALMDELTKWMKEHHLKQEDAALILHISRPRVSYLVNKRTCKFTIDALVNMLTKIGKKVYFSVS